VGRRIVEFEQGGAERARRHEHLLGTIATDLTKRFGRGFSVTNLQQMRKFYLLWKKGVKLDASASAAKQQTPSVVVEGARFSLPWSHYVTLLAVEDDAARAFYEREALAGGWTIRQLKRQIGSQFFQRAALSKNKVKMLRKGEVASQSDVVSADEEVKDPLVFEFLNLKDEYSETNLEEGLIRHLEDFLLELGGDFTFVGRQKRLRIEDAWFRVDLVLYHRRLRCLVIIDLKLGDFSHADVGQMNVYLNYARRHWTHPDENPPVGLILSAGKNKALVEYAMQGITNTMLAGEYRTQLPSAKDLEQELVKQREVLEARRLLAAPAAAKQAAKQRRKRDA
jgi:predicted nuclease of restriction endonuclease-like (RecB) superfamily